MDGTGLVSCSKADFGVSVVESLGSATREVVMVVVVMMMMMMILLLLLLLLLL